ncbi:MAG: hypothetical protein PHF50_00120 [Patescibacteria group bacterium]|nr:hypothetical protein [Patescibacteria group bacterium]
MEKYYFINHIAFGKLYFYIIFAVFVIALLTFIILLLRHKNNFHTVKESFLNSVLTIWLLLALVLVSQEIKWLITDYPDLVNKSQIDKAGFFYKKFADDDKLIPFLKFIKENVNEGNTALFISPSGFNYTFARYYLYPEIKIIKDRGAPDYIFLYNLDPARLNASRPLEIYKSFAPDKNILRVKI